MAKKICVMVIVSFFAASVAAPAYCDDALKKLGRGTANVLTAPLELLEQQQRANRDDGPFAGLTYGVFKGVCMTGVRALVGVYEIVTFPIPIPKNYKPILKNPEFFLEDTNY